MLMGSEDIDPQELRRAKFQEIGFVPNVIVEISNFHLKTYVFK